MPTEKSFRHRATLKQQNKPFKSKHATKGALKEKSKGKVNRISVKEKHIKGKSTKADRRNAAKLLQKKKREEIISSNRLFEGRDGCPKIVAVVSLCADIDARAAVSHLYSAVGQEMPSTPGLITLNAERFKQKFQFIPLRQNLIDLLDALKVADSALFLMSAQVEVNKFGELALSCIMHQSTVTCIPCIQHLQQTPANMHNPIKKSLLSFIHHFFPGEDKIYQIDVDSEAITIMRTLATQRPKPMLWRDQHPYMLAEEVRFEEDPSLQADRGTLCVTGYARGAVFSANRLVHLQNYGDFQLKKISSAPLSQHSRKQDIIDNEAPSDGAADMLEDSIILDSPNPAFQESLIAENEPDFMNNEQTWPTEEEMADAEEHMERLSPDLSVSPKKTKRVPKGTSAYQAAWIVDDDDDSDSYSDEDSENEEMIQSDNDEDRLEKAVSEEEEEYEEIEVESKKSMTLEQLDPEEEELQLREYLKSRTKDQRDDMEFPDEVDTPLDIPARKRFQRYRGLESFRTSSWDPYENLPIDYARIFQFEDYKRTKTKVVMQAKFGTVKSGRRICLEIRDVPREVLDTYDSSRPFIVFGLLQHEHKMTILNFTVTRDSEYTEPVKSKDPLVLHVGFRRFTIRPLFSQNSRGGKDSNNVHKYERFLHQGRTSVATIYGPTQFGALPCLLFKETSDVNNPILVATGSFMSPDTKRIIAKRIILTGYPFKVHKRSAVVRYMFFNPEDVLWFKPVKLRTKYGRSGHIRESLGTHGYMKCLFDGSVTQQDTVMMNLYKRVFPKWNTELWKGGLDNSIWHGDLVKRDDKEMEL